MEALKVHAGDSEDACPDVFLSKQHLFLIQTQNTDSLIFRCIVPKRGWGWRVGVGGGGVGEGGPTEEIGSD